MKSSLMIVAIALTIAGAQPTFAQSPTPESSPKSADAKTEELAKSIEAAKAREATEREAKEQLEANNRRLEQAAANPAGSVAPVVVAPVANNAPAPAAPTTTKMAAAPSVAPVSTVPPGEDKTGTGPVVSDQGRSKVALGEFASKVSSPRARPWARKSMELDIIGEGTKPVKVYVWTDGNGKTTGIITGNRPFYKRPGDDQRMIQYMSPSQGVPLTTWATDSTMEEVERDARTRFGKSQVRSSNDQKDKSRR